MRNPQKIKVGDKVRWLTWPEDVIGKVTDILDDELLELTFRDHKDVVVEFNEVEKIHG